ncbi:MAG: hypothetical protein GC192_10885 [Bacteroidetes bacterium]|nr:hypothetical protein [Bacteroidota bacterium]
MDLSLTIGIIGTFATLIFGVLSLNLFKTKKYPGELTFYEEEFINLINTVSKNFNEVSIKYKDKIPALDIIFFSGTIFNTGEIDIIPSNTEAKLSIELNDSYNWLDLKVVSSSHENKKIIIDNAKKASFELGLFRKNELLQFEGLIQVEKHDSSKDSLNKIMQFQHRIANTKEVVWQKEKIDEHSYKSVKKELKSMYFIIPVSLLIAGIIFFFEPFNSNEKNGKPQLVATKINTGVEYSTYLSLDSVVYLRPTEKFEKSESDIKMNFDKVFNSGDFKYSYKIDSSDGKAINYLLFSLFLLGAFANIPIAINEYKKSRRMKGLVDSIKKKNDSQQSI